MFQKYDVVSNKPHYKLCMSGEEIIIIPYSGYYSGGKMFMVFVVERQTTKFLPTKQYHIVPGCGLVYRDHKNISTNWPKIHCSRKFYPPKNTHYMVISTLVLTPTDQECSTLVYCTLDQWVLYY